MTPAARLSTAIEILDMVLAGQPAGLTLTNWGRQNRYAGSKDRAAIRDIVFDCLRSRRSLSQIGGRETGRAQVLAYVSQSDVDLNAIFTGNNYDPDPVTEEERTLLAHVQPMRDPVRLNYPDFLDAELKRSLGADFEDVMEAMLVRAPVDLRVNSHKGTIAQAQSMLDLEEIETEVVPTVPTALRITENHRRVGQSKAYKSGLVELQDASSQAAALFAKATKGQKVLDYCAGGGGKALALYDAVGPNGHVMAHDIASVRMNDLPVRAARAGARISIAPPGLGKVPKESFDLVFVDAPCSGSGSWRRTPDAKWRFVQEDLDKLVSIQSNLIREASEFVRPGGTLCYATCSLLNCENVDQIDKFLSDSVRFELDASQLFTPLSVGDGFFAARLLARD